MCLDLLLQEEGGRMRDQRMIHSMVMAVIVGLLGISVAKAKDEAYGKEQTARACIHKRLAELVAQANRNAAADATLTACANDLKAEMKKKGKTECEVSNYIGWIVTNENSKLYGVKGAPYKPDKAFLLRCGKSAK
jgi:hypothetical protein